MRHLAFVCFARLAYLLPLAHFGHVMPWAVAVSGVLFAARPARADVATDKARKHYETGLELFYAREHAQALVEFQRAHEVKPRPATLFMMGQCEYLLGALRTAREHYEAYLRESPTGEFVEVAKDRIEAISRRPATLVINSVPAQVDIRITAAPPADAGAARDGIPPASVQPVVTGQAPNNFTIPRGRWVISASKTNYQSQQATVEVEVAETKPLFFQLEPIPARLEIETIPAGSTLYVNGNRTSNPYRQDVTPGHFQLFGEATDYENRTLEFDLGPGDKRLLVGPNAFRLRYVQRSGRPELVTASALIGGLVGAGAVANAVAANTEFDMYPVSSTSLTLAGALTGSLGAALIASSIVPAYIPDNRGLFVIGGMWVGAANGALVGIILRQAMVEPSLSTTDPDLGLHNVRPKLSLELSAAFFGSLPGLVLGTTAGALFTRKAPTYGRVALIQSAAAGGAVVGSLTAMALRWNPFDWQTPVDRIVMEKNVRVLDDPDFALMDLALPALVGLNVGLGAGLLGAYLPDQSRYGPSWKRIWIIDLAAAAGALAGGIGGCVAAPECIDPGESSKKARGNAAALALLGGAGGLVAGILFTEKIDANIPQGTSTTPPPSLTLLPVPDGRGGVTPTLSAVGFF